jgi:D-inositol-3-phosphate glycosyltransferase
MFHTLSLVKALYHGSPDPHDSALRPDGERCVIGSVDAIVGATSDEEEYMTRLYGRTPRRFEVIPPGVDLDVFRPLDRRASRAELGIGSGRVILFVGRADRIKGLQMLLAAVAEMRPRIAEPIRLVIVGTGNDRAGRHSIAVAAARLGLEDVVDIRGTVPHEGLPRYYSAADVLAMPSAYESFGMAAVEAMACGTPVVAFRVGGLAETVCDGLTGYLAPPGNRDELARLLETVLTQSEAGRLGRQARFAANRFRWQNVVARTLDLYEDLVHQQRFAYRRVAGES